MPWSRPLRIVACLAIIAGLSAGCGEDDAGVRVIDTGKPHARFVVELEAVIRANGLLVAEACGECGIQTVDIEDPDAAVLTVTRPGLMMQLLKAGAAAGADPPLRFYISRRDDGTARLTYHRPSRALAVYGQPALKPLGKELDAVFERIAEAAAR